MKISILASLFLKIKKKIIIVTKAYQNVEIEY